MLARLLEAQCLDTIPEEFIFENFNFLEAEEEEGSWGNIPPFSKYLENGERIPQGTFPYLRKLVKNRETFPWEFSQFSKTWKMGNVPRGTFPHLRKKGKRGIVS